MTMDAIEQVIGRAVLDEEFRELLFSDPEKALAGFDLTDEERKKLLAMAQEEFRESFGGLGKRITKGKFLI